jgi:tRNA threonylcarbamoyladenosine biosynthesis protein TsaE
MIVGSSEEMKRLGEKLGSQLISPQAIQLIGDVGTGKTTLTKGISNGLGISSTVQSPSFIIFSLYRSPEGKELHHYDLYRLSDPGLMSHDIAESLNNPKAITVIEWGNSVQNIIPENSLRISIYMTNKEDQRKVIIENSMPDLSLQLE